MPVLDYALLILFGCAIGTAVGWFAARTRFAHGYLRALLEKKARIAALDETVRHRSSEISALKNQLEYARGELKQTREELLRMSQAQSAAVGRLERLSAARDDMDARAQAAENIVRPVSEALKRCQQYIQAAEQSREKAYGSLAQQVNSLMDAQNHLQKETGNLARALQVPHVRGRWGEMTLRRVAELAGMVNRCDFFEQQTASSAGGPLRPDMVVKLPGDRRIVVDAKVPLAAYLEALEAETEDQSEQCLRRHAGHVKAHVDSLAQKSYWQQFQPTPEFVVLFIPGENFFSAALTHAPGLIETGAGKGVVLATPTTLISLLKAVSFGWRREKASQNAQAIIELGTELFKRLGTLVRHLDRLGRDIEKCAATYNLAVGSFERRVLSSARKFKTLGISAGSKPDLPQPAAVGRTTRTIGEGPS